jgi:hypothetical protein
VFASDGSLEDRALVSRTRTTSRRGSALSTSSAIAIIRGGYGVFYNQFERAGSEDRKCR